MRRPALPRRLDGGRRRGAGRRRPPRARRSSPPPVTPAAPARSRRPTACPLAGLPDTEYPASSPYAVAVGGTTLLARPPAPTSRRSPGTPAAAAPRRSRTRGAWQNGVVPTAAGGRARAARRRVRRRPEHRRAHLRRRDADADRRHQPLLAAGDGAVDADPVQPQRHARVRVAEAVRLYTMARAAAAAAATVPGFHDVVAGRQRHVRRDARLGLHDRPGQLGRRRAERRPGADPRAHCGRHDSRREWALSRCRRGSGRSPRTYIELSIKPRSLPCRVPSCRWSSRSTRPGRRGVAVADWIQQVAEQHGGFDVELVDLAESTLPSSTSRTTRACSSTCTSTPRTGARPSPARTRSSSSPRSTTTRYPGSLKNALDYLSAEWADKAAGIVSYGGVSAGLRAATALKPVLAALRMIPVVEAVSIPFFAQFLDRRRRVRAERRARGRREGHARRAAPPHRRAAAASAPPPEGSPPTGVDSRTSNSLKAAPPDRVA